MFSRRSRRPVTLALALTLATAVTLTTAGARAAHAQTPTRAAASHSDLVTLFQQWRGFQQPKLVNGIPDYSKEAMAAQQRDLPGFQRSLAAIDPSNWSVANQVDYHLVRAEMNGLDFDHRVLRPWENNPAFYTFAFGSQSDQPAREGHFALGGVELWSYTHPLSAAATSEISTKLRALPALLQQARTNLTGNGRDLWLYAPLAFESQRDALNAFEQRVSSNAGLVADIRTARDATDSFIGWLRQQAPTKTGPSGIGIDNYNWYVKNVTLVPYTWEEQVAILERELSRAWAGLKYEEHRNRNLPPLKVLSSAEEHDAKKKAAVTEYMKFLKDNLVMTVKPYLEPALLARVGRYNTNRPLEFFAEVDYRDPMIMRTHGFHWFDLAVMQNEPHASPIRRGPLLYNIFTGRTEGLATAWEEMMLQAGMFDTHPRARELINVLLAQRAARGLGDLMMHANRKTLEEASQFASMWTPHNWLPMTGRTVGHEQHLYLQQPTYGTSYIVGKVELEQLLAERARQLGAGYTLRRHMDEMTAAGLIPVSMLRWQLTGSRDQISDLFPSGR